VGKFRVNPNSVMNGKTSSSFLNLLGITGVGADYNILVALIVTQNKPFKICLPSRILVLLNMLTKDQLKVQEEYEEIVEDIREMVSKFGKVVSMVVPQPKVDQEDCAGMGHVFVEYSAVSSAKFARRVVVC
jgi:splicing factor U2AF 65 kDa subunit